MSGKITIATGAVAAVLVATAFFAGAALGNGTTHRTGGYVQEFTDEFTLIATPGVFTCPAGIANPILNEIVGSGLPFTLPKGAIIRAIELVEGSLSATALSPTSSTNAGLVIYLLGDVSSLALNAGSTPQLQQGITKTDQRSFEGGARFDRRSGTFTPLLVFTCHEDVTGVPDPRVELNEGTATYRLIWSITTDDPPPPPRGREDNERRPPETTNPPDQTDECDRSGATVDCGPAPYFVICYSPGQFFFDVGGDTPLQPGWDRLGPFTTLGAALASGRACPGGPLGEPASTGRGQDLER